MCALDLPPRAGGRRRARRWQTAAREAAKAAAEDAKDEDASAPSSPIAAAEEKETVAVEEKETVAVGVSACPFEIGGAPLDDISDVSGDISTPPRPPPRV